MVIGNKYHLATFNLVEITTSVHQGLRQTTYIAQRGLRKHQASVKYLITAVFQVC